jgi:type VI secretion system protein ImpL
MENKAPDYCDQYSDKFKNDTINVIKLSLKKIKRNCSNNVINIYDNFYKPKLLLLGHNEPGKDSIIQTLSLHANDILTTNNHECRAIINNNQMIFNLPGRLLSYENLIQCWQEIFKTFSKNNPKNPFDGIILTLDLQQIIHSPKATKCKINLHLQNILQLAGNTLKRKIPIHIVITNMDVLIGFDEFFKDLVTEDLEDIWGIELPITDKIQSLDCYLSQALDNMHRKLEHRLQWKLNSLSSPRDISLAYEFPIQFKATKQFVVNNIKQLASKAVIQKFNFSGVFFISNSQANKKTDYFVKYTKKILAINSALETNHVQNKSSTFFTKKLFLQDIPKKTKNYIPTKKKLFSYLASSIFIRSSSLLLILASILSLFLLTKDFSNIKEINNKLFNYRIQLNELSKSSQPLPEIIKLLDILDNIDTQFATLTSKQVMLYFFPNNMNVQSNLAVLHNRTNQNILFPFIKKEIENELKLAISANNTSKTFTTIKAYLMLNNLTNFDQQYLVNKILKILGNNPYLETNNISRLKPIIQQALIKSPMLTLDQTLISKAKKLFNLHPFSDLLYTLFKSYTSEDPIKTTGLYATPLFVPNYLKSSNFTNNYANIIPHLCQDFIIFYSKLSHPHFNQQSLTKAVQHKYVQEYILYWKTYLASLLPNTKIKNTDSINDVLNRLHTSVQYLDTAIKLIEENTKPLFNDSHAANLFNHLIANKLQPDKNLQQLADGSFTIILNKIYNYYRKLKHSPNQRELIFIEIRKSFDLQENIFDSILVKKPSKVYSLNNWLYEFGRSLWEHHIAQSEQHIQNVWQKDIYPTFIKNFKNKYPFNKQAKTESSLEDFTNFFSPKGKLANFYLNYIKPFYYTNQAKWSRVSKNNSEFNFAEIIPEIFIKSQIIQTMYFRDNKLSVAFSLTPIKIEPIIKKVELVINNQKMIYKHNRQTTLPLEWPFESQTIHLMSETVSHQQTSAIFNSDWGVFKLLDKASISLINKNQYRLLFKLNNNQIAFSVAFNKQIHPLIKDVTENFKPPKNLFKRAI